MRVCVVRGTTLRVHPLFLCMAASFALLGQGAFILAALTALLLHEGGHLLAARWLRLRVSQIEITPFGGAMQIDALNGLRPRHAFLLALCGPLANLFTIPISIFIIHKFNNIGVYSIYLFVSSVMLLLVNLLPVLPLDGGRMLLALLSKWIRREAAFRALLIAGRVIAAAAVLSSLYLAARGNYQTLPLLLGFYLLYASALEEKQGAARYLAGLISRRVKLDKNRALPVQTLCAARDMPLFTLLPQLNAGAYHRVLILDQEAGKPLGALCEDALLSAILQGASVTLGEILQDSAGRPESNAGQRPPSSV